MKLYMRWNELVVVWGTGLMTPRALRPIVLIEGIRPIPSSERADYLHSSRQHRIDTVDIRFSNVNHSANVNRIAETVKMAVNSQPSSHISVRMIATSHSSAVSVDTASSTRTSHSFFMTPSFCPEQLIGFAQQRVGLADPAAQTTVGMTASTMNNHHHGMIDTGAGSFQAVGSQGLGASAHATFLPPFQLQPVNMSTCCWCQCSQYSSRNSRIGRPGWASIHACNMATFCWS